jgi:hypothetical protein
MSSAIAKGSERLNDASLLLLAPGPIFRVVC